jgi:hypothetical protein
MRTKIHDDVGASGSPFELDPEALQIAEFLQARLFLDALVGKTIASATTAHERTSISTTDGVTLVFYGFAGMLPSEPQF